MGERLHARASRGNEGNGRIRIFGLEFDALDRDAVVRTIVDRAISGEGGWVVTPNVDIVRQVHASPELARLVRDASLVIVDGAPIEWAGRVAGHREVPRVAGASVTEPLCRAAGERDIPILLLGGRPGASTRAATRLKEAIPGLRVADHCPPFGFESDLDHWAAVVAAVCDCDGGIVFCGFGFPKQERLMAELSVMFPRTWFLGIGGTIDFLAGEVRRAPEWVQRVGFEWIFRLLMEPRRMARRYLVDGIPFTVRLLAWAAQERRQLARRVATPMVAGHAALLAEAAVETAIIPAQRSAAAANGVKVDRIDLDRRTVTLSSTGAAQASVELDFDEYRDAVARGRLPMVGDPVIPPQRGVADRVGPAVDAQAAIPSRRGLADQVGSEVGEQPAAIPSQRGLDDRVEVSEPLTVDLRTGPTIDLRDGPTIDLREKPTADVEEPAGPSFAA